MMYCGDKHNELHEQRTAPARRTKHTHVICTRSPPRRHSRPDGRPARARVWCRRPGPRRGTGGTARCSPAEGGGRCMQGAVVRRRRNGAVWSKTPPSPLLSHCHVWHRSRHASLTCTSKYAIHDARTHLVDLVGHDGHGAQAWVADGHDGAIR